VPAYIAYFARWTDAFNSGREKEAGEFKVKVDYYFKGVLIVGSIANLISCLILTLVLFLVVKLSRKVKFGKDGVVKNNKINAVVTSSHIMVTLGFVVT
jgi:hypothetical protein